MVSPVINILSVSKTKIGKVSGTDQSTVVFEYDQKLTAWEARAAGAGIGQGLLVSSGLTLIPLRIGDITGKIGTATDKYARSGRTKALLSDMSWGKNTFIVDDSTLTQGDKPYRIDVYGKNTAGEWTPYVG